MELFTQLFGTLLVFVYHCFDRIVIHGYLSGLSRPEQVVYFFRQVVGVKAVDKEVLSQRTNDYQRWVEAFARNHDIPIEWGEKGVRKEDHVLPWQRAMERTERFGVYFIFKSMEQGPTFRCTVPKYPTQDPHHRISRRNAVALPTITSTFGMKSSARSWCGSLLSSPSRPPIGSTEVSPLFGV